MSDAEKECRATPASTLGEQIMNPCIAKNEREWWAAAEITRLTEERDALADDRDGYVQLLTDQNTRLTAEVERLRAALNNIDTYLSNEGIDIHYVRTLARAALTQEKPNDR